MSHGTFATVFNCIDGRCQEAVLRWVKGNFQIDYPDTITWPGMDKALLIHEEALVHIKNAARISQEKHGATKAVVVGHHECAGNPVSKEEHRIHIKLGVEKVRGWGFAEVRGLYVNENWEVEEVA